MAVEIFTWTTESGVTVTLPPAGRLKSGLLRKLRNGTDLDFMYGLLEEVLDEENLEKTDNLELEELEAMFRAWQAGAGASRPES
jgi:hypothetical protein